MSTSNQSTDPGTDSVPDGWAPPSIDFVPALLPALPTIADPVLALQARTLKSSLMRVAGARDNRSAELDSNELLEWSGDAILYALVSKRLRIVFPRGTAAELSDLRSRLTSNRTLSHISWRYGLAKNLIFKQSGCQLKSAREDEQRLAANAIEAYCGSVVEADRGDESAVAQWLEKLLVPQVFPAFEHITKSMQGVPERRPRLDTGDPVRDAEHRTSSGRRAVSERRHYKWIDEFIQGQRWTATLQVRGQVVGVGTASKIAAAREIALDEYLEATLSPLLPPPTTDAANPQERSPSPLPADPEKDS